MESAFRSIAFCFKEVEARRFVSYLLTAVMLVTYPALLSIFYALISKDVTITSALLFTAFMIFVVALGSSIDYVVGLFIKNKIDLHPVLESGVTFLF